MDGVRPGTKPAYPVLPVFMGWPPLNITKAYEWDEVKIHNWLRGIAQRVDDFKKSGEPVPYPSKESTIKFIYDGEVTKEEMEAIPKLVALIVGLMNETHPKFEDVGYYFRGENVQETNKRKPPHHFARKPRDFYDAKLGETRWEFQTLGPDTTYLGKEIWNHYDALGVLLMIIGRVQSGSNKDNFYKPLTVMYGKWCTRIGGHDDGVFPPNNKEVTPRMGKWPTMYQCTWIKEKYLPVSGGRLFRFCLGASFAGCDFTDSIPQVSDEWKDTLIWQRLYHLRNIKAFPPADEKRDPDASVTSANNVPFGNCAEVYPYVMILRQANGRNEVGELAVEKKWFIKHDKYDQAEVELETQGPCGNCRLVRNLYWDPATGAKPKTANEWTDVK